LAANTFPSSTLTLGSLQATDTQALLDIRPALSDLRGPDAGIVRSICERLQHSIDNIQQTLRSASPSLQYLQIDAADIQTLFVGGQYGPGELTVLNGLPNFDNIGWIGSRAKATSVNITSIVAGLVTAAAPHLMKPGDNVFIENTTDVLNTGFYVVATTPLTTTFTVTGGVAGGNSTGGDMTKQFQGEWVKMFAAGGTAFDNAPLQIDVDGSLSITNALITLTSAAGKIVIDPTIPSIVVTSTSTSDVSSVDPTNGFVQTNGVLTFQALGGAATVSNGSLLSRMAQGTYTVGDLTNVHARLDADGGSGGGSVNIFTTAAAFGAGLGVSGGNGALFINGVTTQVVGARKAGWTAATGTATRTTFATSTVTLSQLAEHVKALIDDLISGTGHGLLGP